jgi:iron complex transport system substrate-binding protein
MWELYDEMIAAVPPDLQVDECVFGLHWTLIRSRTVGMAHTPFEKIHGSPGSSPISRIGNRIAGMSVRKLAECIKSRIKDIPKSQRKLIFNGYSSSHLVTLGGDTFMQKQIDLAGCRNASQIIMSSGMKEGLHTGLAEVSMEKVLGWNPDIIVIDFGTPSDLYNDSKWKNIKAVKTKMVFNQPVGVFIWDRPTAESAALHPLWLAKLAYPERFTDINLVSEIKKFYHDTMDFNLTDDQAQAVLSAKYTLNPFAGRGR